MLKDKNLVGYAREATDFLGNKYQFDCMGCSFSNGEIKPINDFIYESDNFFVVQDIEIPLNGFLVISTKKHINSYIELTKEEQYELADILEIGIRSIKELNISDKITLVQEEKSKHFHVWLFPNSEKEIKKFGAGVSYVRSICQDLKENATKEEKEEIINTIEKIREYYKKNLKR